MVALEFLGTDSQGLWWMWHRNKSSSAFLALLVTLPVHILSALLHYKRSRHLLIKTNNIYRIPFLILGKYKFKHNQLQSQQQTIKKPKIVSHSSVHQNKISGISERTRDWQRQGTAVFVRRINPFILLHSQFTCRSAGYTFSETLSGARDTTVGTSSPVSRRTLAWLRPGPNSTLPNSSWVRTESYYEPETVFKKHFAYGCPVLWDKKSLVVWTLDVLCQLTSLPENGPGRISFTSMDTASDVSLQDTWCQVWGVSQWAASFLFLKDFKAICLGFERMQGNRCTLW